MRNPFKDLRDCFPLLPRRTVGQFMWMTGVIQGIAVTGMMWIAFSGSPWCVAAGILALGLLWFSEWMLSPAPGEDGAVAPAESPGEPGAGDSSCGVCGRSWEEHDFGVPHPVCACPPRPGQHWKES